MPPEVTELDPRRWRVLPVLLAGSFLSFLDFFIVNIALPAMHEDLAASAAQLQFVVAGYGIGFAVSLITGGRLGDIFGRKRVFVSGLFGFTLTSALCAMATNPTMLIASRVVQAVTAAALTPQVLAIIRVEFAPDERPFAIGLYGTSMGFASIVAQVLGGLLVSIDLFGWSWRLIFLINIPIGLVAVCLAARMLRESRSANRVTLDLPGAGLISLGLFLLIYPLVKGRDAGWPAWSISMLIAALPVFYGFVRYEQYVIRCGRTPLVALHLLRVPIIAFGLVVSVVFFSGLAVFFVVLTVFFQAGFAYSAWATGMMFLPFAIGFSGASAVSGRISARIGSSMVQSRRIAHGARSAWHHRNGPCRLDGISVEPDPRDPVGSTVSDLRAWSGDGATGPYQYRGRRRRCFRPGCRVRRRAFPYNRAVIDRIGRCGDWRCVLLPPWANACGGGLCHGTDGRAGLQFWVTGGDTPAGVFAAGRGASQRCAAWVSDKRQRDLGQ